MTEPDLLENLIVDLKKGSTLILGLGIVPRHRLVINFLEELQLLRAAQIHNQQVHENLITELQQWRVSGMKHTETHHPECNCPICAMLKLVGAKK